MAHKHLIMEKYFLIKYIMQYYHTQNKHVLLYATRRTAIWKLSHSTSIIHIMLRILAWSYVIPLQNPQNVIKILTHANVIIIDVISMMTNTLLCAVQKRIVQSNQNFGLFSFSMKLVILVGDRDIACDLQIHSIKILYAKVVI